MRIQLKNDLASLWTSTMKILQTSNRTYHNWVKIRIFRESKINIRVELQSAIWFVRFWALSRSCRIHSNTGQNVHAKRDVWTCLTSHPLLLTYQTTNIAHWWTVWGLGSIQFHIHLFNGAIIEILWQKKPIFMRSDFQSCKNKRQCASGFNCEGLLEIFDVDFLELLSSSKWVVMYVVINKAIQFTVRFPQKQTARMNMGRRQGFSLLAWLVETIVEKHLSSHIPAFQASKEHFGYCQLAIWWRFLDLKDSLAQKLFQHVENKKSSLQQSLQIETPGWCLFQSLATLAQFCPYLLGNFKDKSRF